MDQQATSAAYDVIVIGAGMGGVVAAMGYGRAGLRVLLVDKASRPDAYKKVCTHFIQPSATPVLQRLGLDRVIEGAGGVRNHFELYTRWGWISPPHAGGSFGYNIRRETLDPLLRQAAAGTANVTFRAGVELVGLHKPGRRITGAALRAADGTTQTVNAALIVGADGSRSRTAALAGCTTRERPNNRFVYFTYYRNVDLGVQANSRVWYLGDNIAYAYRNDANVMMVGAFFPLSTLAAFRDDVEGNFRAFWQTVPGAPVLREADRCAPMRGMLSNPNRRRALVGPGVALVGDAALTLDPIWGTGLGFAAQAAAWLTEATVPALLAGRPLAHALRSYRRRFARALDPHAAHICDFSKLRDMRAFERLIFSAATADAHLAADVLAYIGRERSVFHLLRPTTIMRAINVTVGRAGRRLVARGLT